jgi:hypothetical protein
MAPAMELTLKNRRDVQRGSVLVPCTAAIEPEVAGHIDPHNIRRELLFLGRDGPGGAAALSALGPPPPKDISASAIEEAKSCRSGRPSAIVGSAERHEHVRDADLNLFQDLRPLTS